LDVFLLESFILKALLFNLKKAYRDPQLIALAVSIKIMLKVMN